jgi:hypothetical protein
MPTVIEILREDVRELQELNDVLLAALELAQFWLHDVCDEDDEECLAEGVAVKRKVLNAIAKAKGK